MKRLSLLFLMLFLPLRQLSSSVANTSNNSEIAQLTYTEGELAELSKWSNMTLDDLTKDALNCDRAALYNLGMCYLTGIRGFVIDVENANSFFAQSASLGFAPALDKLKSMYIEDKSDPLLALVYLNLAASFNHPELVTPYHKIRAKVSTAAGNEIVKEIEKIATEKRKTIEQNISDHKSKKIKTPLDLITRDITDLDCIYSDAYWQRIAQTSKKSENKTTESSTKQQNTVNSMK